MASEAPARRIDPTVYVASGDDPSSVVGTAARFRAQLRDALIVDRNTSVAVRQLTLDWPDTGVKVVAGENDSLGFKTAVTNAANTAQLRAGEYTAATLAVELQAQANAVATAVDLAGGWAVVYDPKTWYIITYSPCARQVPALAAITTTGGATYSATGADAGVIVSGANSTVYTNVGLARQAAQAEFKIIDGTQEFSYYWYTGADPTVNANRIGFRYTYAAGPPIVGTITPVVRGVDGTPLAHVLTTNNSIVTRKIGNTVTFYEQPAGGGALVQLATATVDPALDGEDFFSTPSYQQLWTFTAANIRFTLVKYTKDNLATTQPIVVNGEEALHDVPDGLSDPSMRIQILGPMSGSLGIFATSTRASIVPNVAASAAALFGFDPTVANYAAPRSSGTSIITSAIVPDFGYAKAIDAFYVWSSLNVGSMTAGALSVTSSGILATFPAQETDQAEASYASYVDPSPVYLRLAYDQPTQIDILEFELRDREGVIIDDVTNARATLQVQFKDAIAP